MRRIRWWDVEGAQAYAPPVSSLTAHLRPGPESVRDAPQRGSQVGVVAQQHGEHVGVVYPLYPYLGVGPPRCSRS